MITTIYEPIVVKIWKAFPPKPTNTYAKLTVDVSNRNHVTEISSRVT